MPSIKGAIVKSPNIISLDTGEQVSDAGNLSFNGGEVVLAPVYKQGQVTPKGKKLGGLMVDDKLLEKEKAKGIIEYKPMFMFQSKDELTNRVKSYYMPAKEALANVQMLKASKDDAPVMSQMISQLESLKDQYNKGVPNVKSYSTYGKKAAPVKKEAKPSGNVMFVVDGKKYNIPSNEVAEFRKAFPKAKQQ